MPLERRRLLTFAALEQLIENYYTKMTADGNGKSFQAETVVHERAERFESLGCIVPAGAKDKRVVFG